MMNEYYKMKGIPNPQALLAVGIFGSIIMIGLLIGWSMGIDSFYIGVGCGLFGGIVAGTTMGLVAGLP